MKRIYLAVFAAIALAGTFGISPAKADDHDRDNQQRWDDRDDQRQQDAVVWRGSVDDVVDVFIRGNQVWSSVRSGDSLQDEHVRVNEALPPTWIKVRVDGVRGRGKAYVFQEPNRHNGFTAGIRIEDRDPGRSDYRVAIDW